MKKQQNNCLTICESQSLNWTILNQEKKLKSGKGIFAIWDLEPYKAPGPSGFTIVFYKKFQGLVKYDLCKMIKFSLKKGEQGGSTISSFLALIPKEKNP